MIKEFIKYFVLFISALLCSCTVPGTDPGPNPQKDYTLGFEREEDLAGIVTYNKDGGYNTQFGRSTEWFVKNDFRAHSGNRDIGSVYNDGGTPNNDWLVLPLMKISSDSKLTFFAAPQDIDISEEEFHVKLSANKNVPEDFSVSLADFKFPKDTDSWRSFDVDLGSYGGQSVYIAFNCTSIDQYCLRIDDIMVTDVDVQK